MEVMTFNIDKDRRNLVDDKQNFNIDFHDSKYNWLQARQYEESMRQVEVHVVHGDGSPVDLTGVNPVFEGWLPEGVYRIIDAKHSVMIDAQNGIFRFDFPAPAFQIAGSYKQAFFRLMKDGMSVTTLEFSLDVMADKVISGLVPSDYFTPFEDLYGKLKDYITQANGDFNAAMTQWKKDVANLITELNADTSGINLTITEIKTQLTAIKEQIKADNLATKDDIDNALKPILDLENNFDFEKSEPYFLTKLQGTSGRVAQCFAFDDVNKQWFETQVYDDSGVVESYVITRHDINGKRIDSMYIKNGGHGTSIGLEVVDGVPYIWSPRALVSDNAVTKWQLIRFKYVANSIGDDVDAKVYDHFNDYLVSPYLNQDNGLIAMFLQDGADGKINIRKLDDIKNGKDNVLYTIKPDSKLTMQGMAIDGTNLYWLTGLSDEVQTLYKYQLSDGTLLGSRTIDFGQESNGKLLNGYREPEGLFFYTDRTGQVSLMIGMTVGSEQNRQQKVYALSQRGALGGLSLLLNNEPLGYAVGGTTKPLPDGITAISDIKEYGQYYLTAGVIVNMTDNPLSGVSDFGYWLEVSAKSPSGAFTQVLRRNSSFYSPICITRIITNSSIGEWSSVPATGGHMDVIPDGINALSKVKLGGDYYITTDRSSQLTDHPEPGVAGWFFSASQRASDPAYSRLETLTKNTSEVPMTIYTRITHQDGTAGDWCVLSRPRPRILNAKDGLTATNSANLTEKVSKFKQLKVGYWLFDNFNTVDLDVTNPTFPVIRKLPATNLSNNNDSYDIAEMQITVNEVSVKIDSVKIITNGKDVTTNTDDMKVTWIDGMYN